MIQKFQQRFSELEEQLEQIGKTKHTQHYDSFGDAENIDDELLNEWRIKAKTLITNTCGQTSEHYKAIIEAEKGNMYEGSFDVYKRIRSVFNAAKEDYLGGYTNSIKNLVQAEVFDSEIEQAEELLSTGYYLPAAVIAGVVLETTIRELCTQNKIGHGKLDKMNSDLAKAGIYSVLQQKRITTLADIRNSAAHGKKEEFKREDVEIMIRDVRQILGTIFQ